MIAFGNLRSDTDACRRSAELIHKMYIKTVSDKNNTFSLFIIFILVNKLGPEL